MDEVKQYRVRPGFHHGAQGQYGPGAVVELTEAEAAGFLDKLELVAPPASPETPELNISKGALKWLEENHQEMDFSAIKGTGKDGQITLADVKAAAGAQTPPQE